MDSITNAPAQNTFKLATLNITQVESDVRVRMTFGGAAQYATALGIVQQQDGWAVDEEVTIKGQQLGMHVPNATVSEVLDTCRHNGLTTLPPALVR